MTSLPWKNVNIGLFGKFFTILQLPPKIVLFINIFSALRIQLSEYFDKAKILLVNTGHLYDLPLLNQEPGK
jgi:hypothetical protein